MIITTTGYYHTGSTAIYALLREYSSCSTGVYRDDVVEHLMLYMPNGLFDLEDKLLVGNNIHRSDEALDAFRTEMQRLYHKDFIWFGNFKHYYGPQFLKLVDDFIAALTNVTVNGRWYYDFCDTKFSSLKFLKDSVKRVLGKKPYGDFGRVIVKRDRQTIDYAFPTPEEFYKAGRKFIYDFLGMSGAGDGKHLILDHFLLPHNLYRVPCYFGEDLRVFVVDRDPRDVFIINAEIAKKGSSPVLIPTEIDAFIAFWKKLRQAEREISDPRICRIPFEDLVYHYDEAVGRVEAFCGLDPADHKQKDKYFDLALAKGGTRLYLNAPEYQREIEMIEKELSEFLYLG